MFVALHVQSPSIVLAANYRLLGSRGDFSPPFREWARARVTWLLLGLAVEAFGRQWVGHFSPPLHKWASKTVFWPCRASISGSEAIVSLSKGGHWPRAVTIASSLDSECGLSHERA